jgi:hypothetical protein
VPTTLLEETKSKRACPGCDRNKLITNDVEKFDDIVFSHCLNCGCEFSEDEQHRKYRDSKNKKDNEENSWDAGIALLLAMGATILAINLSDLNNSNQPESTQVRIEQSFSWW